MFIFSSRAHQPAKERCCQRAADSVMNCCRLRTLPSEAHTSRPTGLISEARGILLHFLQLLLFRKSRRTEPISERHVVQCERE
jgi:hypothetical protein